MDVQLATAQTFRYAEELRELHAAEHRHRRATTVALGRLDRDVCKNCCLR